ncbi:MAG: hypothetical protein V2A64_03485 [Candidatus Omnitrophota bacterium]
MMKSRLSLKNSVRAALNSLILLLLFSGCSSSTTPTYLKKNLDQAVRDICKTEYNLDVKTRLIGATLWVYLPVEDIFIKTNKPQKRVEIFEIKKLNSEFSGQSLKVDYAIKNIPPREQQDNYDVNKTVSEKLANVWKVLRRVLFSMEHSKENELNFFRTITADIKNGFEIQTTTYSLDLKKVSYGLISIEEYQHRSIQDTNIDSRIIGDKDGRHVEYKDITMQDFIAAQIQHRIKLKFQKPEVDKNANIDKEILKIIIAAIKIYDFKQFNDVELKNLLTNNKIKLNKAAVWIRTTD